MGRREKREEEKKKKKEEEEERRKNSSSRVVWSVAPLPRHLKQKNCLVFSNGYLVVS